jgi:hypothetical protein
MSGIVEIPFSGSAVVHPENGRNDLVGQFGAATEPA